MKLLAVYVEKITILAMDDHARPVIINASINAMKDIATSTIAFHMMHRTRVILKKENTGMKRMVKVEKKENNPDWLCECCGRAGKIKQVNCTGEKITWHCSECFRDFDHQPRLHGAFRRYRTDNLNLMVSVNEYNNAVDKIEALQKCLEDYKTRLEKITGIVQRYFISDNFYTYEYRNEDVVNDLISIGILERNGNHVGSPEPVESMTSPGTEGCKQ